jgi:hypothetical protein
MQVATCRVVDRHDRRSGGARAFALRVSNSTRVIASLSIATKVERRSAFTVDTLSDPTFVRATGLSVLTLVLATVLGPVQASWTPPA